MANRSPPARAPSHGDGAPRRGSRPSIDRCQRCPGRAGPPAPARPATRRGRPANIRKLPFVSSRPGSSGPTCSAASMSPSARGRSRLTRNANPAARTRTYGVPPAYFCASAMSARAPARFASFPSAWLTNLAMRTRASIGVGGAVGVVELDGPREHRLDTGDSARGRAAAADILPGERALEPLVVGLREARRRQVTGPRRGQLDRRAARPLPARIAPAASWRRPASPGSCATRFGGRRRRRRAAA